MSGLDTDYLQGTAAALREDFDAAIAAFERSLRRDPASPSAAVSLLEVYVQVGRLEDADRLAPRLLGQPADSGAVVAIARLHERRGRVSEAAEVLGRADLVADLSAYVLYLRVLIEAGRFEEALLEAERGLDSELSRPHALIAKGLSLLHFADPGGASRTLGQLDASAFEGVFDGWADGLQTAGVAERVVGLLEPLAQGSASSSAAVLRRKLAGDRPG